MNKIEFAVSIDYQDIQEENVREICKNIKNSLQWSEYNKKIEGYSINGVENVEQQGLQEPLKEQF